RLEGDDRTPIAQRRKEEVVRSADPRPVCGRPVHLPALWHKVEVQLKGRDVTEEDAVSMQRSLGRTGRPGCIDNERGIVGGGGARREGRRRPIEDVVPLQVPAV